MAKDLISCMTQTQCPLVALEEPFVKTCMIGQICEMAAFSIWFSSLRHGGASSGDKLFHFAKVFLFVHLLHLLFLGPVLMNG